MSDKPAFRKGADEMKDASKGGGAFSRTHFFGLDDKGTAVLRFLTDAADWITVDQHQMVPTKAKPDDYPADSKWPEKMGAVCRKDPAFAGMYDDCYICDHVVDGKKVRKPSGRGWALACLREEVIENGVVQGVRDVMRTVTRKKKNADGSFSETETEEITEKAIVVVNMGWKNFFSILQGFAGRYGTILDRDYHITRSGDDQSTTYAIVPLDPIEDGQGNRFDLRNPEHMKRYETDLVLEDAVAERADDEFYARFFDPRFKSSEGKVEATGVTEVPKADNDVDKDRLAALADRVKGFGGNAGTNGDAAPEQPAEQSEAQPAAAASGGGMKNFD